MYPDKLILLSVNLMNSNSLAVRRWYCRNSFWLDYYQFCLTNSLSLETDFPIASPCYLANCWERPALHHWQQTQGYKQDMLRLFLQSSWPIHRCYFVNVLVIGYQLNSFHFLQCFQFLHSSPIVDFQHVHLSELMLLYYNF